MDEVYLNKLEEENTKINKLLIGKDIEIADLKTKLEISEKIVAGLRKELGYEKAKDELKQTREQVAKLGKLFKYKTEKTITLSKKVMV